MNDFFFIWEKELGVGSLFGRSFKWVFLEIIWDGYLFVCDLLKVYLEAISKGIRKVG